MVSVLFALLMAVSSMAQVDLLQDGSLPYDTTTSIFANIDLYRVDNSNSISREFGEKFAFGGYLNRGLKDRLFNQLEEVNHYGASTHLSANVIYFPQGKNYGLGVGYEFTSFQSLQFTDDLFELVFYGNQGFDNRLANLSSSRFLNYSTHKFSFTAVEKSSGSFVSLGLYGGLRHSSAHIWEGYLTTAYTNTDEQSFASEVDLAGYYNSENFSPEGLFGNNIGAGISAGFNFNLGKHQFSVLGADIGFLYQSGAEIRDTSGTFTFSGVNWDYGSDSNVGNAFQSLEDSISPAVRVSQGKLRVLPARFKLRYFTPINTRLSIAATGRYVFDLEFNPELTVALNYHLKNSNNVLWIDGSVGGFNIYSVGFGAQLGFGKASILTIGTRHAAALFYRESTALSAHLTYALRI